MWLSEVNTECQKNCEKLKFAVFWNVTLYSLVDHYELLFYFWIHVCIKCIALSFMYLIRLDIDLFPLQILYWDI
jgi:hypothetical protein